jgi:hypothetical protein
MTFTPWDLAFASIVGDGLLGLLLLGGLVTLGVLDLDRHAGGLERLGQERPVGRLPAHRGLRIRQKNGDLVGRSAAGARTAAAAAASAAAAVVVAATGGKGERERAQADGQRQPATRDR